MVSLNLSLNIGKKKAASNQDKKKSNEEEKNRIIDLYPKLIIINFVVNTRL